MNNKNKKTINNRTYKNKTKKHRKIVGGDDTADLQKKYNDLSIEINNLKIINNKRIKKYNTQRLNPFYDYKTASNEINIKDEEIEKKKALLKKIKTELDKQTQTQTKNPKTEVNIPPTQPSLVEIPQSSPPVDIPLKYSLFNPDKYSAENFSLVRVSDILLFIILLLK